MTPLLNTNLRALRAQLEEIAKDLHELAIQTGNAELGQTMSDLRNRIHEPYMFVIVGEVKSGKSSFINALLGTGREITKVAPQPMTDTIQQILYGEPEEIIEINPFLRKILLPVDILREIAIVDTPGTNTIVEHHQEITERFIPASDLIVFVFEAKNPYRQSAWDFLDFIKEDWHKKVIFVLQQKDLMSAEDLHINREGVREQAEKKGIAEPVVFAVSAKQELEGQTEESGFGEVRDFITANITGGKAPVLKLENNLETSRRIGERIGEGIDLRQQQYEADLAFRKDISETLENQERRSKRQVDVLVENLLAGYDRITREKEQELNSGLGFFALLRRSIASVFSKTASAGQWLDDLAGGLERDLNTELRRKLNEGVDELAESIQQMAKLIDLKISNSTSILRNDHELFSDIAEKRENVMRELQEEFERFIHRSENFTDAELFPDKRTMSPNVATGSGLAVVGIVLATVTQGMVFDITGGVLTTLGLLFAGVSSQTKRRKIMKGFREEVARGRSQLEEEVSQKLKGYIEHLREKIERNFGKFDRMLEREEKELAGLQKAYASVNRRLEELGQKLPEPSA